MTPVALIGLHPTLWRTCRTLANHRRLAIVQLLDQHAELSVSQVAQAIGVSLATASQYLRALNARGLLAVRRHKRSVYYRLGADASIPHAARLLGAVVQTLSGEESIATAYYILTGLTHPRRAQILKLLTRQAMSFHELMKATGTSPPALSRHLIKLERRELIKRRDRVYSLRHPTDGLRRALLHIVKQGY